MVLIKKIEKGSIQGRHFVFRTTIFFWLSQKHTCTCSLYDCEFTLKYADSFDKTKRLLRSFFQFLIYKKGDLGFQSIWAQFVNVPRVPKESFAYNRHKIYRMMIVLTLVFTYIPLVYTCMSSHLLQCYTLLDTGSF